MGFIMLHWFRRTSGPVVVLLHGFAGDVHAWDAVVASMPAHLAICAVCLPGHHPDVPAQPDFERTCSAMMTVLAPLNQTPMHLVGYSLGARLALALALRSGAMWASVTLIGGHVGLEDPTARQHRRENDDRWRAMLYDEGIKAFVESWEAQPIFAPQAHLPRVVREAQRARRLQHDPNALADSLNSTGLAVMPNLWPMLRHNTVPMRFVVGDADRKFRVIVERAQPITPKASLHLLTDCGHNPLLEAPGALADLLGRMMG